VCGEDGGCEAALARRVRKRSNTVLALAATIGVVVGGLLVAAGAAIAATATRGSGAVIAAAVVAFALLVAGILVFRDRLFPALEIASVTPGRRIAQLVTRGLGAGTLITAGVQLLGRLLKSS
jgi:hypothetical protein